MSQTTKKKRTKVAIALASLALVGTVAIGGISAYFTDSKAKDNTFTVGEGVGITLTEPGWNDNDVSHTNIVPGATFTKDPTITNDGLVDAYAFVKVNVPYKNVVTANADGSKNAAAYTELFDYTVNGDWAEVGTPTYDETTGYATHVYVYGTGLACTKLTGGQSTPAVFNSVQFANVVEGQVNGETLTIGVEGYAIQADNLTDGTSGPARVWGILANQAV